MPSVLHLMKRFRTDERGVFLVIFALLALVLIATSGAVVDFSRVQQARTRAQTALDAAALALQGTIKQTGVTAATLKAQAQLLLTERMADNTITATVEAATPDIAAGKLTLTAFVQVNTYFAQLVGIQTIRANLLSEVTRQSSDLEVSLSIDVTGSMAKVTSCTTFEIWFYGCKVGDKIGDLINASNQLIDLLVSESQPPNAPTYSRMAIVPWSDGVNVGSTYATNVRGALDNTYKSITGSAWSSGSAKTLGSVTKGNPNTTINSTAHGFAANEWVYVTGQSGMTCLNGRALRIVSVNTNNFTVAYNTNSGCSGTASGGTATKCLAPNCDLVINVAAHGKTTSNTIYITNSNANINGNYLISSVPSTGSFSLAGRFGPGHSSVTSGRVYCGDDGCENRVFINNNGDIQRYSSSTCASERTVNPYLDTAPSGSNRLGRVYLGDCPASTIQPLTANKTTLHGIIGTHAEPRTLVAHGGTAGHLGLGWGWYMLSPNFSYLWPNAENKPAAYGKNNLVKAVIFMTDGIFNTAYNSGVVSSESASEPDANKINQTASNGTSKDQAQALCDEIKKPAYKTLLYVVGFDLAGDATTLNFLRGCATSVDHFYQADTGASLSDAFKAIAQSLSELRVSK